MPRSGGGGLGDLARIMKAANEEDGRERVQYEAQGNDEETLGVDAELLGILGG